MTQDSRKDLEALKSCFEEMLVSHEAEVRARDLALRVDVDQEFLVSRDDLLDLAIRELIRLVLATVPDGCEIFVGGSRSTAAVSRLGAGRWTMRWQVAGARGTEIASALPTPLHPLPGHAERHARSQLGCRVVDAFDKTNWEFSLEGLEGGVELLATAILR